VLERYGIEAKGEKFDILGGRDGGELCVGLVGSQMREKDEVEQSGRRWLVVKPHALAPSPWFALSATHEETPQLHHSAQSALSLSKV
jgi:hypothetical protein